MNLTTLSSFDTQTLAGILYYLPLANIVKLYATGDGSLMHSMAGPHVINRLMIPHSSCCSTQDSCQILDAIERSLQTFSYISEIISYHRCAVVMASRLTPFLPKCLKKLCLPFNYIEFDCIDHFDEKNYPALPNSLEVLTLLGIDDKSITKLPQNLRLLRIKNSTLWTVDAFKHLPRPLESLILPYNDIIDDQCVQYLPQSLTRLYLGETKLSDACVPHLPRTLQDLILPNNRTLSSNQLHLLPPGLLSLNLCRNPNIDDHGVSKLFLPNLTCLNLMQCHNLSVRCLVHLPPKLVRLQLRCMVSAGQDDNQNFDLTLPPTLNYLRFHSAADAFSDSNIAQLPRHLTILKLSGITVHLTDASACLLPKNLRVLLIHSPCNFTNNFVSKLPMSLTNLSLYKCDNFTEECIADLPRTLLVLCVPGTPFTNDGMINLPPKLNSVILHNNVIITQEVVKLLPKSIKSFETIKLTRESGRIVTKVDCSCASKMTMFQSKLAVRRTCDDE